LSYFGGRATRLEPRAPRVNRPRERGPVDDQSGQGPCGCLRGREYGFPRGGCQDTEILSRSLRKMSRILTPPAGCPVLPRLAYPDERVQASGVFRGSSPPVERSL